MKPLTWKNIVRFWSYFDHVTEVPDLNFYDRICCFRYENVEKSECDLVMVHGSIR